LKLEAAEVQTFQREGYLKISHRVIEDEHIQRLRKAYDQIFNEQTIEEGVRNLSKTDSETDVAVEKEDGKMWQAMGMWERSQEFRDLLYHDPLLDIAECLIGENIQLFQDQALYKPANNGGPIPWHQDNSYWKCQPADLVSIWIALDDVDEENGCMNVIPGSHVSEKHEHSKAKTGDGLTSQVLLTTHVDESKAVPIPLAAGHAMVHHCLTLHATRPNLSTRDRRAMVIHYMPVGTRDSEGVLLKDHLLLRGQGIV
jgi:ectoine hydroxylase-related dioxygenase (phytanoyl-CoA dioxygenase family)